MRNGCNQRVREACYHWARVRMQRDKKARQHYRELRDAGHGHGRALLGVCDRFLSVLIGVLRSGMPYDPNRCSMGRSALPAPQKLDSGWSSNLGERPPIRVGRPSSLRNRFAAVGSSARSSLRLCRLAILEHSIHKPCEAVCHGGDGFRSTELGSQSTVLSAKVGLAPD